MHSFEADLLRGRVGAPDCGLQFRAPRGHAQHPPARGVEGSIALAGAGVEAAGLIPIDMQSMRIKLLAFTGHKGLYGPMGIGGLAVSDSIKLKPFRVGGSGGNSELIYHPEEMPTRLEAGTENLPGIVGLAAGIRFIRETGMDTIRNHEENLRIMLIRGLKDIPGLKLHTPETIPSTGIVSFTLDKLAPADTAVFLDSEFDTAVRSGLHCAPLMHKFLGTFPHGTTRVSLSYFNTEEEIYSFISAIQTISSSI